MSILPLTRAANGPAATARPSPFSAIFVSAAPPSRRTAASPDTRPSASFIARSLTFSTPGASASFIRASRARRPAPRSRRSTARPTSECGGSNVAAANFSVGQSAPARAGCGGPSTIATRSGADSRSRVSAPLKRPAVSRARSPVAFTPATSAPIDDRASPCASKRICARPDKGAFVDRSGAPKASNGARRARSALSALSLPCADA